MRIEHLDLHPIEGATDVAMTLLAPGVDPELVRVDVGPGDLVTWDAGELHTTWATTTLTAVIVQRSDS